MLPDKHYYVVQFSDGSYFDYYKTCVKNLKVVNIDEAELFPHDLPLFTAMGLDQYAKENGLEYKLVEVKVITKVEVYNS